MKVGIIVLATNKYAKYIPDTCESIHKFFVPNQEHTIFVLTDSITQFPGVVQAKVSHHPWPKATLLRYHKALAIENKLKEMDYVFQCDADMRFVAEVGDEILSDLVATDHPWYWNKPLATFPYERNQESMAYIPHGQGSKYYAGAFLGGRSKNFLDMAKEISTNVDIDLKKNFIAIWHDESHLQAYLIKNPPTKVLDTSYCYSEPFKAPFPKRIICLEKDHKEMRQEKKILI